MSWTTIERGIRLWTAGDGVKTYHVDVQLRGRRKTGKARTVENARKLRARLLNDLMDAEHFPEKAARAEQKMRLEDFIERYKEDYVEVKAARSKRQLVGRLEAIKEALGADTFLNSITAGDLQRFLARGLRGGWSPATYNRYRTRLHNMFRKAVDWDLLLNNPAARLERLKENKLGDRYLNDQELSDLLDACDRIAEKGASIRPLVALSACTGMRQGEIMGLRWEDIEPDLAFVTLRGSETKTGEPRRVPLVAEARRILESFGTRRRGRLWPWETFPRKPWDDAIKALGWDKTDVARLRGWRFHDMRHHAASRMVMAGMSLYKVGKVLGHTQAETTQRYAHLAPGSLVEDMESAFSARADQFSPEGARTGKIAQGGS